MRDSERIEIQEVELQKIEFGYSQMISRYLLESSVYTEMDYARQALEINVRGYLWGEDQKGYSFQYPRDWWEAFKERWFPARLKLRWPVKYTKQDISVTTVYPDLKISMPSQRYVTLIRGYETNNFVDDDEDEPQ